MKWGMEKEGGEGNGAGRALWLRSGLAGPSIVGAMACPRPGGSPWEDQDVVACPRPGGLVGLSYAGWIGCFSSPAATIGPAGLFLLGCGPGSLLTAAVW